MKKDDIRVGVFYSDDKRGLRKVVRLGKKPPEVVYQALGAGKTLAPGEPEKMALTNFARWAKREVSEEDAESLAQSIVASRIAPRLTPGQCEYLKALHEGSPLPDVESSARLAGSCRGKGLVQDRRSGVHLTSLGAAVAEVLLNESGAKQDDPLIAGCLHGELFDLLLAGTKITGAAVIAALRDHLVHGLSQMEAWEKHEVNRSQFTRRLDLIRAEDARAAQMSRFYPRDSN